MRSEVRNKGQQLKPFVYFKQKRNISLQTAKYKNNLRKVQIRWKFQFGIPSWKEEFKLCFILKLFRFFNFFYCIIRWPTILIQLRICFFFMISPKYQNEIEIYSVFNLLRHLLLHRVLNFQMVLNLRNHFRIRQFRLF